ncbi:MAG TPA: hypothetical protein VD997_03780 [Phycisphaerales bacterium]|nr:hypothetical protein [Phycisphaerales bacterium]
MTRAAVLLLLAPALFLLTACALRHTTPDGHTFRRSANQAAVQKELGPPDLVHEGVDPFGIIGGPVRTASLYYLSRGYRVGFREDTLRAIEPLDPNRREWVERMIAVQRLAPRGSKASEVLERLGDPDYIWVHRHDGRRWTHVYEGPFSEYGHPLDRHEVVALWRSLHAQVVFTSGAVTRSSHVSDEELLASHATH